MRRRAFAQQNSWILVTDSRGRLQLPKDLREHSLFELRQENAGLRLQPLKTVPVATSSRDATSNELQRWFEDDVRRFIEQRFRPKIEAFSRESAIGPLSVVLFGSRARGTALNGSDFDLAVFVTAPLNAKLRRQTDQDLHECLREELDVLHKHGVTGDLAVVFVPSSAPRSDVEFPPIYASIATDGVALADSEELFASWQREMRALLKKRGYRRIGEGKAAKWVWGEENQE